MGQDTHLREISLVNRRETWFALVYSYSVYLTLITDGVATPVVEVVPHKTRSLNDKDTSDVLTWDTLVLE